MHVDLASRRSVLLGALALGLSSSTKAWPLSSPARPVHAPRPSDVCFSSRWPRENTIEVAQAFGATRLDWCYTSDKAFVEQARAAGLSVVGGALEPGRPDLVGSRERNTGRIVDRAGNRVTTPWMRVWPGVYWGCVNSPDFRRIWVAHASRALEAGVDWFVVDGAAMNGAAVAWGGCFCMHCRLRAAREGADLDRDMLPFQQRSVARFHRDMRSEIDRIAGRRVTFAFNCLATPSRGEAWYDRFFDFGCCEINPEHIEPRELGARLMAAERAGRPQMLTLRSRDIAMNRRVAAWAYSNGGHMIAPWDVYLAPAPGVSGRFFGDPKDFASIFLFARRLGRILDDATPVDGIGYEKAWFSDRPGWFGGLRVSTSGDFAVLHLVSWAHDGPAKLTVDPARILPGGIKAARVLTDGGAAIAMERRGAKLVCGLPTTTWAAVEMQPN